MTVNLWYVICPMCDGKLKVIHTESDRAPKPDDVVIFKCESCDWSGRKLVGELPKNRGILRYGDS